MPLTPAQKQAAYRARKAQSTTPAAPSAPEATAEDVDKVEQMSRAAGVSRNYPLSVWKRAAQAFITGDGKVQDKVKVLRGLVKTDKDMRKRVAEWVRTDQSEASRKYAAAQGWTITDGTAPPTSLVDQMVACLEAGKKLDDNFTAEELASPRDPTWAATMAEIEARQNRPVVHGCNYCGFNNGPATRQLNGAYFCDRHDGSPRPGSPIPVPDPSPAGYINSDFGKTAPLTARAAALAALGQAIQDGGPIPQRPRADYGPTVPPEPKER